MKSIDWERLKGLRRLLAIQRPEPARQAERIVVMQRNMVLPAKFGILAVVLCYLYYSGWTYEIERTRKVWQDMLEGFLWIYLVCNVIAYVVLFLWRRFPTALFQWLAFTLGLLDGLFVAGLTIITGGFESIAFWVFPGLIVLNALSIPLATPQIVLNLLLSVFYITAVFQNPKIGENELALLAVPGRRVPPQPTNAPPRATLSSNDIPGAAARPRKRLWQEDEQLAEQTEEIPTEPLLLRVSVLWLLTICCYSVDVLAERQRRAEEEAHEMGLRQGQLRSAGRLAAEFAHQIKNPLAIINTAAFSLQRALKDGRGDAGKQLQIIQEEIERSDKIVTQIMGYAKLSEGRIEKLNFDEELERALEQVFPPAVGFPVKVERRCESGLPPLLMQRNHLDEMLVNILQNSREALGKAGGRVSVNARRLSENLIEISIANNGPPIPGDKLERIFEAHYTTKEKGTGLGLAIVKHNVELYAGSVRAESLGKGVRFVLVFPAKTVLNPK